MLPLLLQVGVFVSIISTKIPFKGAGKEYIGDDIEEMVGAVKQAIQACGVQLRVGDTVALGWSVQAPPTRSMVHTCRADDHNTLS